MNVFPTKILLATDGSEDATLAAETAIELAKKTASELHVLYVGVLAYGPVYDDSYSYVGDYAQEQKELDRISQQVLDEQVRNIEASGGSVAQAHLDAGSPEVAITDLAEQIGAGLIVMGSRGLGGIKRTLMGSVSDSVVRHAHCPVLVVRK
jgi:nucleotide-binding universal stress UspA family protein